MNTTSHKMHARPSVSRSAGSRIAGLKTHLLATLAGFLSLGASAQTLSNYQWIVASQSPMSWFKFDNGGTDSGYTYTNAVADNTSTLTVYGTGATSAGWLGGSAADVFHTPGKAVFFSGSADVLDVLPGTSANIISGRWRSQRFLHGRGYNLLPVSDPQRAGQWPKAYHLVGRRPWHLQRARVVH